MSFVKRINHYRRQLTRGITSGLIKLVFPKEKQVPTSKEIKTILIVRPNSRLGNQLLISPLIETLHEKFPNAKIELFVRGGISEILYKHHQEIHTIYKLPGKPFKELKAYLACWIALRQKKYDWVINVDYDSSSGRLATLFARADFRLLGKPNPILQNDYLDYNHMAKQPVYHVKHALGILPNTNFIHLDFERLNIRLQETELANGQRKLMELSENNPQVVGVFTYATGNKIIKKKWWKNCLKRLQAEFPQHAVVEFLPKENVSQLDFSIPSLNSGDLRLIASMMYHCDFIIAADSGMMHLASASGSPTIGLFNVTDTNKYQPYGGSSFAFKPEETSLSILFERLNSIVVNRQEACNF